MLAPLLSPLCCPCLHVLCPAIGECCCEWVLQRGGYSQGRGAEGKAGQGSSETLLFTCTLSPKRLNSTTAHLKQIIYFHAVTAQGQKQYLCAEMYALYGAPAFAHSASACSEVTCASVQHGIMNVHADASRGHAAGRHSAPIC
eukprot:1139113-Pelagomonas_calceolata.AAC.1